MMFTLRKKASRRSTKETRNDNLVGADVTVDDFANTLRIRGRFKKSVMNVSNEVKQEVTKQDESLEWDGTNGDTSKDDIKGKRNRRRLKSQKDNEQDEGIDYPLDIWFIISEYVRPETVGKFASICKSSYYVTTTGKFWFHLYKSYYKFVPNLPERLQPQCMRLYGLRACVIRALYYTYFNNSKWIMKDMSYLRQQELYSLVKRKCVLMWHKEVKGRWDFYFKLKEISTTCNSLLKRNKQYDDKNTEFLDTSEDVAVNPEDGCKVLRVSCSKYSMLPPVIGLVLQTVSMNLMPDLREQRLQLGFGTSNVPSTLTSHVILRNIATYSILNWWNLAYPHQDVTNTMELSQNDTWD